MSDRLTELQRQRALLQEHLAWLEREIAAETAGRGAPAPRPPAAAPPPSAMTPRRTRDSAAAHAEAETILEQYRDESRNVQHDVKKGCFLYFALAFLLLGIAVAGLYFYTTRHH